MGAKTFLKNQINCKKIQKVASVIKKIYFVVFLLCTSVYSQNKLEGRFVDEYEWFDFQNDGIFKYAYVDGDLCRYGQGHYTLTKDSLFLNYDLTDIKYSGYHIMKTYQNLRDSIDIKLTIYDFEKNVLPETNVLFSEGLGKNFGESNAEGKVKLTIKKEKGKVGYLMFFYEETMYEIRNISLRLSYEIDVFLSKIPFVEPFDREYAIKDAFQKYKVLKNKKNYLELQGQGSVLRLKKVENGYYFCDPFE